MSVTITTTSLLPIRRDKQISSSTATISGFGGISTGGGGGASIVYTGGTGILVTGTTISVIFGSTSTTVACGSHLHTGVYLPVANPIATGTLCAPIICATTCTYTPILLASTCACSPIICGSTCVVSPLICNTICLCACDIILANNETSTSYTSGYAGSGFKLCNCSGVINLELDNLKVRNNLTAYQLEINEVTAVNGGIVVSSANGVAYCVGGGNIYFDTDGGLNPINFANGDIIKAQVYTGAGVASYLGRVTAVNQSATLGSAYVAATTISGTPWAQMKLVQVGNCATAARQNLIYVTASDTNNPYLSMLCGVTDGTFTGKERVRLGNLAGITDACFGGALTGYGLYSDNIYIKGQIVIAANSCGYTNLTDKPTIPTNTNQLTDGANLGGTATWSGVSSIPTPLCTPSGSGLFLNACAMGYYSGGVWQTCIDCTGSAKFTGVMSFGTCTQSYGGCLQNIAMCGNCMWENSVNDEHGAIVFNWSGYGGGTSRYRDAYFGDGKQNTLLSIVGSCHLIDVFGSLNVRCCSTMDLNLCVCGCAIAMDYILSSDCRLKTNIKPIAVSAVNVLYKEYEFIADPNKKHYGVVAQDLQEKYPELVNIGSDCMLGVNYTSLFAREIATLKCQVKDLQNDLNYYRNYNDRN